MDRKQGQSGEALKERGGKYYLDLLDLGHLADVDVTTSTGKVVKARNFLDICGDDAIPVFVDFEATDRNDPSYADKKKALQTMVLYWVYG